MRSLIGKSLQGNCLRKKKSTRKFPNKKRKSTRKLPNQQKSLQGNVDFIYIY